MDTSDWGKIPIQFGSLVSPLFGWYHPPGSARRAGGIIICNPLGDDLVRAHRPLRHLAERLAAAGFPVLRFDYRGTGDAAGDESEPARVPAWLTDIGSAVDELRARSGVARVALVGLRAGAVLAWAVGAGREDVDAVVSWTGFAGGGAAVDEMVRTHRLHRKLEPQAFSGGPSAPGGEESLGFFLSDETMAGLREIALGALPRRSSLRGLVLAPGESDAVTPALAGFAVERRQVPPDKFLIVPPHQGPLPEEALAVVGEWLEGVWANERSDQPGVDETSDQRGVALPASPAARGRGVEEPHFISGPGRLFGILHRPAAPRSELPALVLLNAGCVPRMGAHRQYLPLARRWAGLGFSVLRLDLSGIGDSPAAPGAEENLTYPPRALDDIEQALTWLAGEAGARQFVLAGLCSGADLALAAADDPRVAGVVMMNPRTFFLHELGAVESFKGARWYQDALHRKDAWVKLLRGQVDLVRVARTVAPKALQILRRGARRLVERDDGDAGSVPARLRGLAERGVDLLLVVAPHDPGIDYVDANFGAGMAALRQVANFRRAEVPGTDHTFTALWAQRAVADLVTEHLAGRYLAATAAAPASAAALGVTG
jgi:dienelactone hydrolase